MSNSLPSPRLSARVDRLSPLLASVLSASLLSACALPGAKNDPVQNAYVLLGEQGQAVARVLTLDPNCPQLNVDGSLQNMQVRAAAGTEPLRKTVFPAENSRPSYFAVTACELNLAAGVKSVQLNGQPLPLPVAEMNRILVLGDSGCRIVPGSVQACNDSKAFPFAQVAATAARWKPQLVVHVGDYHYREAPCPEGNAGCAGSPWGYGWDAWQADFFAPAKPLLQAAPWVMVRGNHESCRRAGQGWWRFLDPRPLQAGRDCNLEQNDSNGDFSEPYAVPLGNDAQILVLDSSAAAHSPVKDKQDMRYTKFERDYKILNRLSNQTTYNFAASHHPILGIYVEKQKDGTRKYHPGNPALQTVFLDQSILMLPPRIQTLLAGHTHTWQQLSFSSGHPSNFISGNAGSLVDPEFLPPQLPPEVSPGPGAVIAGHAAHGEFGYMTLERQGADKWLAQAWDKEGNLLKRCEIENRNSQCK